KDFEIQVLYGMAEPIAHAFATRGYLTRMYVPLGDLLPGMGYLVRRLLENTSNESFLRHTFFDHTEIAALLEDPSSPEPQRLKHLEVSLPTTPVPAEHSVEGLAVNLDY
ncbi:MAG: hypothetical protein RL326_2268, partial [Pseudomonadota bacterium]